jgi:hypothetical protein
MRQRLLGPKHPDVGGSLDHLAILQVARGQYAEALVTASSAVEILSAALSPDHWKTAVGECAKGAALTGLNRMAEATPLLQHGAPARTIEHKRIARASQRERLRIFVALHCLTPLHRGG